MQPPTSDRLVFTHAAEALLRSLGPRLTPSLTEKLAKLGLKAGELPPAFEYERWKTILATVGEDLKPGQPQLAHHELGELLTDAFLENFIGRALKPIIKLIGMKRALGRMRQNFRVANNYSEVLATEIAPGHFTLRVNETGMMAYFYRGILDRGLRLCDPKNLSVGILKEDAEGVVFAIRWDL